MIRNNPYFQHFKDSSFDGNYIKELDTSVLSREQWLVIRNSLPSIGGSDGGTILGLNPYKDPIRLYYEKLGVVSSTFKGNNFTYWGSMLEDKICESWSYYDDSVESMIDNQAKGVKVKQGVDRPGMLWNPKHPHLVANIDHEITYHPDFQGHGILEAKTISGYAQDKWESGVPVYYIPQPYIYMIVTGARYAEFAILRDGRDFTIATFTWKKNIIAQILSATEAFAERMEEGFKVVKRIKNRIELLQELAMIEPDPSDHKDYGVFMSQKHVDLEAKVVRDATEFEINNATEYKRIKQTLRLIEEKLQFKANLIKKSMSDSSTKRIIFEGGSVSFNKKFIVR